MALVLVDNGEKIALEYLVNKVTAQEDLVLRLFSNNITPGETDVVGSYTEVTGGNYAAKTLTGASWTVSGTAPTEASYAEQTWTFNASVGNVYGYYVTRSSTGDLIWAEVFTGGPFNVANNGDVIKVTPKFTMA